jgi:hypothetical protein
MILYGYKQWEWAQEATMRKARCIAHFVHRGIREGFSMEHAMKKGKGKGKAGEPEGLMDHASYIADAMARRQAAIGVRGGVQ